MSWGQNKKVVSKIQYLYIHCKENEVDPLKGKFGKHSKALLRKHLQEQSRTRFN